MTPLPMFGGAAAGSLGFDRLAFGVEKAPTRSATNEDPIEARAIAAVKTGDAAAYDYPVPQYMRRDVSIAPALGRNAAVPDALAPEASVQAFGTSRPCITHEPAGPGLLREAAHLRLHVSSPPQPHPPRPITDAAPAERRDRADLPAIANELAERIDRGIESLPEMQRMVARLYLVEEFGHSEIAKMTGLSEGTVRSHLSLARGKLKEKLADLHGGSND